MAKNADLPLEMFFPNMHGSDTLRGFGDTVKSGDKVDIYFKKGRAKETLELENVTIEGVADAELTVKDVDGDLIFLKASGSTETGAAWSRRFVKRET